MLEILRKNNTIFRIRKNLSLGQGRQLISRPKLLIYNAFVCSFVGFKNFGISAGISKFRSARRPLHREQVGGRKDGAEIQNYRHIGQYGAFCGSECVHFFHGGLDLVKTLIPDILQSVFS